MHENIRTMLERYSMTDVNGQKNALHEIVQEIVMLGLSRGQFFRSAAFYGGTALRMFYGLDRFSEDLDFTLLSTKPFSLEDYRADIESTLASYGFAFSYKTKLKAQKSVIESAFIKGNTAANFITIGITYRQHQDEKIKIKLEVDTNPALGFHCEAKLQTVPTPYYVNTLDLPSLFAGKLHAILFRQRQDNIKGRDWYDLTWYLRRPVPYNLQYLSNKIRQTLDEERLPFANNAALINESTIKQALLEKVETLDIESAKRDVGRFLKDPRDLDVWSYEFFRAMLERLQPATS